MGVFGLRIQTHQEPPARKMRLNLRLLSWLAFEGGISKQIPSHPLIPTVVTSKTSWVSVLQVPPTLVQVPQGVPVCSLTALGQAASPGKPLPWGCFWVCHFHPQFERWLCGSRGWEEAGRRPGVSRSPAPGVWIRQKALELVTKVWMWAGKYSPVS